MKTKCYSLFAALLCAVGLNATDYAPVNWKFADMPVGSAAGIFNPDGASNSWSCSNFPTHATDGKGGALLSVAGATGGDAYFKQFYENTWIVDGGSEHLFCIIGKGATATYPGATALPEAYPNTTIFWYGGTSASENVMPLNQYYRLIIDYRVITTETNNAFNMTLAGGDYYGIDNDTEFSGNGEGGYRQYTNMFVGAAYNNYWLRSTADFYMRDPGTGSNALPLVIKMWTQGVAENAVVLFRSFQLLGISKSEVEDANVPASTTVLTDFSDNPNGAGVSNTFSNGVIAFGHNGVISVIDATEPIEVYNAAGALVSRVNEVSTLVNIPVSQRGVFIVKTGSVSRKVVL